MSSKGEYNEMNITLQGPVGAGKSTFSKYLSIKTGFTVYDEPVKDNPYLDLFYESPDDFAFGMQMFLMKIRFMQLKQAEAINLPYIMDMSIYGNDVFAELQYRNGHMNKIDYENYQDFSDFIKTQVQVPDVIVYLQCSPKVCIDRIIKRGRQSELQAPMQYWFQLCESYEKWFKSYEGKKLLINVDDIDVVSNEYEREKALETILNFIN